MKEYQKSFVPCWFNLTQGRQVSKAGSFFYGWSFLCSLRPHLRPPCTGPIQPFSPPLPVCVLRFLKLVSGERRKSEKVSTFSPLGKKRGLSDFLSTSRYSETTPVFAQASSFSLAIASKRKKFKCSLISKCSEMKCSLLETDFSRQWDWKKNLVNPVTWLRLPRKKSGSIILHNYTSLNTWG